MDVNAIGMGDGGFAIMRSLLSLVVVLGLVVAAYLWLKRRGTMLPGSSQKRMRVIERLPIDAKRSILLLEVDGKETLVGVGNDTLSTIQTPQNKGEDHA